jgi:hypothetical protein
MIGVETVIIGVVVFILGQVLLRFVLEPIHAQRTIIGEIASAVIYLGNVFAVPPAYAERMVYRHQRPPPETAYFSRLRHSCSS